MKFVVSALAVFFSYGWVLSSAAEAHFSLSDAGASGVLQIGEAEASYTGRTLSYRIAGDGVAGVWSKDYPSTVSADAVGQVRVALSQVTTGGAVSTKLEVKGTTGVQVIDIDSQQAEATIDWPTIGKLQEVVLVVSRQGDTSVAEGKLDWDVEFLPIQFTTVGLGSPWLWVLLLAAILAGISLLLPAGLFAQPLAGLLRDFIFGAIVVFLVGIGLSIFFAPNSVGYSFDSIGYNALVVAFLGWLVGSLLKWSLVGGRLTAGEAFADAAVPGLLAATVSALPILHTPQNVGEVFSLCGCTAAVYAVLYHLGNVWKLTGAKRHLSLVSGLLILATPYACNVLLAVGAEERTLLLGVAAVFLFNEFVANGIALVTRRKLVSGLMSHVVLLLVAVWVVLGPKVAGLGSIEAVQAWPDLLQRVFAVVTTVLSQAGLWAEAYLLTGLMLDGIHGRHPDRSSLLGHARSGIGKGMIYSGIFIALMHALYLTFSSSEGQWLMAHLPWLVAAGFGAILFPLLKTIIESFDGSPAFVQRARQSYRSPWLYLRGAIIGAAMAWVLAGDAFASTTGQRILVGLVIGVVAFAGVSLLRDGLNMTRRRGVIRSWRAYLVDAAMGGFIGMALGFYLDSAQVGVVVAKFHQYVSLHQAATAYETIPFLNRWGHLDLGDWTGGVSLLFRESLAGVINWSIAAWLFAINRTFLSAALDRNTAPIKFLFTREGLVQLIQHMIEVMRWGLWMSPIIFSFLRMMGEPTWYNQDGLVRSVIATINQLTMSQGDFVQWSLSVFVALLAYDIVRVLIWIDHMGLRVATLVNFSFLGMEKIDGWVSRFIGRDATARYIPEGVKRFTTWAPLLIPFYIPMGAQWDQVWDRSAEIRAASSGGLFGWLQGLAPLPVLGLGLAAMLVIGAGFALVRRLRSRRSSRQASGDEKLSNQSYEVVVKSSGESYSSLPLKGYDLTRRSYDPRDPCGRALFVVENDGEENWPILGNYPEEISVGNQVSATAESITLATTSRDLVSQVEISLPCADEAIELWEVQLENTSDRDRQLKLSPYVEWVINEAHGDRGHTQYNRLFPELSYESAHNAALALHRKTKLYGILASSVAPVGILSSRIDYIGRARSLWDARALETLAFSPACDTPPCPSFDPISALLIPVEIAAGEKAVVRFLVGCAKDKAKALALVDRFLKPDAQKQPAQTPRQPLIGHGEIPDGTPQPYYSYLDEGNTLRIHTPYTPRPWDHSMSNALGHVLCVTNRGLHTTASGNAQQNRVTPDWADTTTRETPGEAIYLYDTEGETWLSPTWEPLRDEQAEYQVDYSVEGTATFTMTRPDIETELTVFVPREDPTGLYRLTIRNRTDKAKRLRVAPYFQMSLADMPENAGSLKVKHDTSSDALYYRNPRNTFRQGVAFVAMTQAVDCVETRRGRFYGQGVSSSHPQMVATGRAQAESSDMAPVAALLSSVEVPAGGEVSLAVMLGQADDRATAEATVQKYQSLARVDEALAENRQWWRRYVGTTSVKTNDEAFDQLQNWLKYQALAERIWARRGFYQSSGAFGYRDQLQDSVNLIWVDPSLARKQLMLHAAQQFIEGDSVHWFFLLQDGRTGFACRSHAYDNLLWLGWGVSEYVRMTGDTTLLDEPVSYLQAEQPFTPLPEGKHGMGFFPQRSPVVESVYHHCLRAFDLVFEQRLGPNGLPLIGAGDWNDGLDEIGSEGRGESTWLGFFLCYTMRVFLDLIEEREGAERRAHYQKKRDELVASLEKTWRDDRYLRAIHDDGTEIGVKGSGIWEIDALTAAWSVMSGINPERSRICFDTAVRELEEEKIVKLGTPALRADSKPYLGRSSQYPEGVRENGMYCHGDQWLVRASRILVEQCLADRDEAGAAHYRKTGLQIWQKISPLFHVQGSEIEVYGGQPNKQAADILTTFDPGRMIWNGYTGAAGWVLREVYEGILGCELKRNQVVEPEDFIKNRGELEIHSLNRDLSSSPF